jgi:heme A synthase
MMMSSKDMVKLIEDLQAAILIPGIGLGITLVNVRLTRDRQSRDLKLRVMLSFLLALFLVLLGAAVVQNRVALAELWSADPTLYSFVYVGSCVVVIACVGFVFYWKLRPQLWKRGERSPI